MPPARTERILVIEDDPGVSASIEMLLPARGYRVEVAARARDGLARAAASEFDLVITAQDVGAYKPSAKSFPALLDGIGSIGVAADNLLHVAQSLFHDHVPAKAAGLPSVWIDRRHDRPGFGATPPPPVEVTPDWRFTSMAAFAAAAVPPVRET